MRERSIPNGDREFALRAQSVASAVAKDAAKYGVSREESERLQEAVARFRSALDAARRPGNRSQASTREKNDARAEAERQYRRVRDLIRLNETVSPSDKMLVKVNDRPQRARRRECPTTPPRLRFVRALHESGATPMHELQFQEFETYSTRKPAGAVRIEIFVDLVPPDEPIPAHPGANHGGRPWYLRSYTKNPIVLAPPMARVPMRVVYWGRWADSLGDVGPFSATAAAWIEGGSHHNLPGAAALAFGGRQSAPLMDHVPSIGPAQRESTYSIAILDARCHWLSPTQVNAPPALPAPAAAPAKQRRLEGPPESEAA